MRSRLWRASAEKTWIKTPLTASKRPPAPSPKDRFDKSLVPVYNIDGELVLDKEEFPRPQTTLEGLAELQPSFAPVADYPLDESGITYRQPDSTRSTPDLSTCNHVHHAGNSSGVVDGAGALLLASPDYAKAQDWKPRANALSPWPTMGDCPTLMLNAPVPAAKRKCSPRQA